MMHLYIPTPRSFLLICGFFIACVGMDLRTPLTAQTTAYHLATHSSSQDNHQKWINYYTKELESYGAVRQLDAERGVFYNLHPKNAMHHHLRFITTQNDHPGYYPKIRLTYYDQNGDVVGIYTSSSTDIVRMGNGKTFLQVDLMELPTNSHRTTLTVLEGEGTILTVFE